MTPEGWRILSLGQAATLQRGFDLPVQSRRDGKVPVVASNGPVGTHDVSQVDGPGVVTGRSGTIGRVFFYEAAFWPLNTTLYVSDFHGNDPRFIARLLESFGLEKHAASTGVPSLNRNFIHPLPVLLPPLGEQKKIAAILSSVDEALEATQVIIDQLQVVKKAMMVELLTRGLSGRHSRFKQTDIGDVPEDWAVLPAEQVCSTVIDCKNRTPPYTTVGYPVIRTPNVRNGRLVTQDLRFTDADSYEEWTARGKPLPGDLVITREAPVGEVCLIPQGMTACLGQRMMLMRPAPEHLLPGFLLAALQGDGIQRRLELISGGSTVGHVRVGDIRTLPLPIPPLPEQQTIGDLFARIAERIEREDAVLEEVRHVKAALTSVLLTGEVRVKPDEEAV